MRVLLTNVTLATRTGTEIVTRDLALGLHRAGHDVCVFSPDPGGVADEIAGAGVPVVNNLHAVPFHPQIIHGHHHVETTLALLHFRSVPAIFVCHDRLIWHDSPPKLSGVRRYVAVDHNCLERLINEAGIPAERTRVILNAVDLERFVPRKPLPPKPARALVFSNYATNGTDLNLLRSVCEDAGIGLAVTGKGVGVASLAPERVLGDYDLVFAKARCALEALAAGCAVILRDWQGLGPMVTSDQVQDLREWNFGMRCLQAPLTAKALQREITRYDRHDATEVSAYIRSHASLDAAVSQYVSLYKEVLAEAPHTPVSVSGVVTSLARSVGVLESVLRGAGEIFAMRPLPRTTASRIRLRVPRKPPEFAAGSVTEIPLEIDNRSSEVLASLPPFPVNVAYHWVAPRSRSVIVYDGGRTELSAPVRPRTRHSQNARVLAPKRPGRYVLLLTLVQEFQFWFDAERNGTAFKMEVMVRARDGGGPGELTLAEVVRGRVRGLYVTVRSRIASFF
ncbi:MAG: glycosyltransferase [Bryobacterales bacterium]|nr:glycosyltransferase [Bryobacterales bacterium]